MSVPSKEVIKAHIFSESFDDLVAFHSKDVSFDLMVITLSDRIGALLKTIHPIERRNRVEDFVYSIIQRRLK